MDNIKKLQYVAQNKFHSLDEITRLLIIIVADLEIEIEELKNCVHTPNETTIKAIEEVEEMIEKPKKKNGLFRK